MFRLKLSTILVLVFPIFCQAQQNYISDAFKEKKFRDFDFWIGAWEVNLRIKQQDNSWKDQVKSKVHIYPILDGKAVLELWNETSRGDGIKGYSLRYYDPNTEKWELWLNWPGQNRSGSTSLAGEFRHGRGEFFSTSQIDDSTELIARYTFCDITANSLRWDDAFSRDKGKTWTNNWIMEFTRTDELPPNLSADKKALTFNEGKRCDMNEFRTFEALDGNWEGTVQYRNADDKMEETNASLKTHKVLDGCAVISFLEYDRFGFPYKNFSLKSYNTSANKYEDGRLDNLEGSIYQSYFGDQKNGQIELSNFDLRTKQAGQGKYIWKIEADQISFEYHDKDGELMEFGSFRKK